VLSRLPPCLYPEFSRALGVPGFARKVPGTGCPAHRPDMSLFIPMVLDAANETFGTLFEHDHFTC
jgi:hypothetical protein